MVAYKRGPARSRSYLRSCLISAIEASPGASRRELAASLGLPSSKFHPSARDVLAELVASGAVVMWRDESYYPPMARYRVASESDCP